MEALSIALGVLAAVLMWHFHRKHRRETGQRRRAMFDEVLPLLENTQLRQEGIGFPTLDGFYHGHFVRIEPIEEHVGFRKVPSMWLRVSMLQKLPYRGVLDFLVRPENIEFYSPISRLPHQLDVPPGWPQPAWLRSDDPGNMPPLDVVGRHLDFFEDRRAKELLITGRGVRLVYQALQAERTYYLVLRGVTFKSLEIPRQEVQMLLDRALAIADDLKTENVHE